MALSFKLLQTVALLSLFHIDIMNMVHSQTTTSFSFNSFDPKPSDATYCGDATALGDRLSLTKIGRNGDPVPNSVGRVVYSKPVQFWEPRKQTTFETTFTFNINQLGKKEPAAGIAFFMAPVSAAIPAGSAGGNLGIFNAQGEACNLFAVEFDSRVDKWDPSFRHMGIDISSRYSRMVKSIDEFVGDKVTATITYKANTVTVVADYGVNHTKMWYQIDLSNVLPQRVQVGISGATGDRVEYNYLHSWNFTLKIENPYDVM